MNDAVRYYTAAQVRSIDRSCIQIHGITALTLMQRAAQATYRALRQRWPQTQALEIYCGAGNNAGDGYLIAELALADGLTVNLCAVGKLPAATSTAGQARSQYLAAGGHVLDRLDAAPLVQTVIVDALLGTGLTRPLAGDYLEAVARINARHHQGTHVMAVDIPTGLHADTGAVLGAAVCADLTVTFIARKLGLVTGQGPALTGELIFADLDTPAAAADELQAQALEIPDDLRADLLPPRQRTAHKGRHGHLLCLGGDYGYAGAIRLAGEAALRSGAGLVSVGTRPEHAWAMGQARPELMATALTAGLAGQAAMQAALGALLARADVLLLGPGLGQSSWAQVIYAKVMEAKQPLLLDADGLNLLAVNPQPRDNWVLTPHPGEAARLLGCDVARVQADRPAALAELAERYNAVVVLKGAGTLVGDGRQLWLCRAGNPGMAVAGMGDVLAGVIAALLAQRLPPLDAARLGAYVHARAGDLAAQAGGERGLQPSDLLPMVRQLVNP